MMWMGVLAAQDAIILAFTPKAQHILLCLILEQETSELRRWRMRSWRKGSWRKAGRNEGVNRSLIQHIPSLDSRALLNKAFDIGCYWS